MRHLFASTMLLIVTFLFAGCGGDEGTQPITNLGPSQPSRLVARFISSSQVRLTWNDNSHDETGFQVFESVGNDSSFIGVGGTAANVHTMVLEGRDASLKYFYKVRAYNETGNSFFSNVYEVQGGYLAMTFGPISGPVTCVDCSPDGLTLVTGSGDYKVHIWDINTGEMVKEFLNHTAPIEWISFKPSGGMFSTSDRSLTYVFNADLRIFYASFEGSQARFTGDSRWLAAKVSDGSRRLNATNLSLGQTLANAGQLFCTSRDGRWMVTGSDSIRKYDLFDSSATLRPVATAGRNRQKVLAVSPDGEYCITRGVDSEDLIYTRISDGVIVQTFEGHTRPVYSADISPDGTKLASASEDYTARIWDIANGTQLFNLTGHTYAVYWITWSPDGRYVATASGDKTAKLWGRFNNGNPVKDYNPINFRSLRLADHSLKIRIVEMNGHCPVFRLGDEFKINAGYVLEGRETYCMNALSTLMPFYIALAKGVEPSSLGLCKEGENVVYFQCPDPQRHSGGGTVVFEMKRGDSD